MTSTRMFGIEWFHDLLREAGGVPDTTPKQCHYSELHKQAKRLAEVIKGRLETSHEPTPKEAP